MHDIINTCGKKLWPKILTYWLPLKATPMTREGWRMMRGACTAPLPPTGQHWLLCEPVAGGNQSSEQGNYPHCICAEAHASPWYWVPGVTGDREATTGGPSRQVRHFKKMGMGWKGHAEIYKWSSQEQTSKFWNRKRMKCLFCDVTKLPSPSHEGPASWAWSSHGCSWASKLSAGQHKAGQPSRAVTP